MILACIAGKLGVLQNWSILIIVHYRRLVFRGIIMTGRRTGDRQHTHTETLRIFELDGMKCDTFPEQASCNVNSFFFKSI